MDGEIIFLQFSIVCRSYTLVLCNSTCRFHFSWSFFTLLTTLRGLMLFSWVEFLWSTFSSLKLSMWSSSVCCW